MSEPLRDYDPSRPRSWVAKIWESPVMIPCLIWAMLTEEIHGVWGGLGPVGLQQLLDAQSHERRWRS